MSLGRSLRTWVSDPPLSDRLLWRGLLNPGARELGDPALEASAFGAVYTLGGLNALQSLRNGDALVNEELQMVLVGVTALAVGAICLLGYRRLPRWFFQLTALAGIGLVSLAADAAATGATAVFAPFYAFVGMLALLFFRLPAAIGTAILAAAAYGVLLYERDTPFALQLLLSSIAMLSALGVLILVIRTRTSRVAGELSADALTDPLTELANRRGFDRRFDLEVERSRRDGSSLALVICDLDHFKRVNDELGHDAGDEVLRRVATAIAAKTRDADLAARIGGEEFGVLLPGTGPERATLAAERVRHAIAEAFAAEGPELTASCGIASGQGAAADPVELFRAADEALYRAKRAGRDCTALSTGDGVRIVGGGSTLGRLRQSLGS